MDTEIAIVGGGPAGLSAALILGRARRQVVLFDAGRPRNAPAHAAHNLLTRDGTPPAELIRIGREQLAAYPSVQLRDLAVVDAERLEDGTFLLRDADGQELRAQKLVLATGVVDELPAIPGLQELWGTGVFHCPYCHGWEVQDEPFVLLAQSPHALHLARMLRGWSVDLTLCPVDGFTLEPEELAELEALDIRIRPAVAELIGEQGRAVDVVLVDGTHLGPAAVFTTAPLRQRSDLAERLGCTVHHDGMFRGMVDVDERCATNVPGVWAVGDASRGFAQVVAAAYEGTLAGGMINAELLMAGQLPRS